MAISSYTTGTYTTNPITYISNISTTCSPLVAYPGSYLGPGSYLTSNGMWSGAVTATGYTINKNLSEFSYKETLSIMSNETIKDYLYKNTFDAPFSYNLSGHNYFTLVENDLSDELVNATGLLDFYTLRRGLAVVAYDIKYNKLEISSICKEEEAISNIDSLLDNTLAIRENKKDYFSSLKSRYLPIVGFKFSDFNNTYINLKKNVSMGLLPVIHVPNYIYNLSTNPRTTSDFLKASKLLESISSEVYLVNKSMLPDIQPYFSPEYSYLSLINDKTMILKALEVFDKSKKGLIDLLTNITINGTNVVPFIDLVIDHCALNQNIANIESYAYIMVRNLIESNLI